MRVTVNISMERGEINLLTEQGKVFMKFYHNILEAENSNALYDVKLFLGKIYTLT